MHPANLLSESIVRLRLGAGAGHVIQCSCSWPSQLELFTCTGKALESQHEGSEVAHRRALRETPS